MKRESKANILENSRVSANQAHVDSYLIRELSMVFHTWTKLIASREQ